MKKHNISNFVPLHTCEHATCRDSICPILLPFRNNGATGGASHLRWSKQTLLNAASIGTQLPNKNVSASQCPSFSLITAIREEEDRVEEWNCDGDRLERRLRDALPLPPLPSLFLNRPERWKMRCEESCRSCRPK